MKIRLFTSRGEASKVFAATEQSLDQIACLVQLAIEGAGNESIGPWWNHRPDVLTLKDARQSCSNPS